MLILEQVSDAEKLAWLRVFRTKNIGPRLFLYLYYMCGSMVNALHKIPELSRLGGEEIKPYSTNLALQEIENMQKHGANLVVASEMSYPELLRRIIDFPPVITVKGNISILNRDMVAIVGSRAASLNGCKIASKMATDLGGADLGLTVAGAGGRSRGNIIVTSGLARGIDTAAHKGALANGTVAVTACGIDVVYPPENKQLFNNIAETGAVITEMPYGTAPRPQNFPRRNRIISGMSLATVVVEANLRSGSLITARYASDQGREVFAVPGSPLDPRCSGPNAIIKDGGYLAENAEDVVNVLKAIDRVKNGGLFDNIELNQQNQGLAELSNKYSEDDVDKARIVLHEKLGVAPVCVDDIISQTSIPANIVMVVLTELELAGRLERLSGNRVSVYNFGPDLLEKAM